jgi:trk system potassium uptake protein TrkA
MKFIVVGLGYFGSSLATELTALGHEVIGLDNKLGHVEMYKNQISHTIAMDCTDQLAVSSLPLKDTDVVVVGIGEDFGASVMSTALFKQMKVKRLIARAISPLHQNVLEALGVDDIIRPEQESAERLAHTLEMNGVINSFGISDEYSLIEVNVPKRYIGYKIMDADIRNRYNLNVITLKRELETINLLNLKVRKKQVIGVLNPEEKMMENDVLVVFGKESDFKKFLL